MGDALVKVTKLNKEELAGVSLGWSVRWSSGSQEEKALQLVDSQPWFFGVYTLAFSEICLEESQVRGIWREECSTRAN